MLRIEKILPALVLLAAVFFGVTINSIRTDGLSGSPIRLIASENQLGNRVVTFQEFYNPTDYKWEGSWDPRWERSGLPRSDRDYDRSTGTIPPQTCDR